MAGDAAVQDGKGRMQDKNILLAAMAEIGAMRRVLVQAMALKLVEEPSPLTALEMIERHLTAIPSAPPPDNGALDPAVSDMLAALTDERTESILSEVRLRLGLAMA